MFCGLVGWKLGFSMTKMKCNSPDIIYPLYHISVANNITIITDDFTDQDTFIKKQNMTDTLLRTARVETWASCEWPSAF